MRDGRSPEPPRRPAPNHSRRTSGWPSSAPGSAASGRASGCGRRAATDFVILERADAVGGTWRDNTYPGCTCDVPSHLYSFSFAPNPDWSHGFSRQPEIWAYLDAVTDRYGMRPYIRFGTELAEARWDAGAGPVAAADVARGPDRAMWSSRRRARCPRRPCRTSRGWTPSPARSSTRPAGTTGRDLAGKRVAVIGTGASAIQIVPAIQPAGGPADPVPAHPGLGHAAPRPADHRRRRSGCTGRSR